ncbi:MAG: M24 family metallopeptidase, partial [Sphingopyxis sp.]|nr:M24 family metallopeptidase [Sphingopyxis sp.]
MRERGIDMWIMVAREYLEDPVVATMLDATSFHARRRTILVFFDPGDGRPVERLTVSRYGLGGLFAPAWNPEEEPDQWARLGAIVAERNPRRIALNRSPETAFGDGMTASQYDETVAALPPAFHERVVSGEGLSVDWLQERLPSEIPHYGAVMRVAHALLAEALSARVITAGQTTAADVQWWLRHAVASRGMAVWFHPSISIFRKGSGDELSDDTVIQPGDLIWSDFGIMGLGLATDSQALAYVLRDGESAPPDGIVAGMAGAVAMQDMLVATFRTGASGNDMLAAARESAIAAGLDPSIYSHPIGTHGHGAGPAIGFWDDQTPTPRGAGPLRPRTAWSIELANRANVAEWDGQRVPFRLEVNGWWDGDAFHWIAGRQEGLLLIPAR